MRRLSRRQLLQYGLALGSATVAGCIGEPRISTPPSTESSSNTTGQQTRSVTPIRTTRTPQRSTASVEEIALQTGEGSCGSTANVEITRTNGGVRVRGAIVAPTPCYEATLTSVDDHGRLVRFTIDIRRSLRTPTCAQCIAEIPFRLIVRTRNSMDTVVVALEGRDPLTVRKRINK